MPVKADPIAWGARLGADEILEKRSRHSKHFRNPDGSFTAVIGQYLHYESTPGTWDDVDLNFRASGSDFIADKHEVNSRVSGAWLESWDRKTSKGVRWLSPAAFTVSGRTAKASGQGLTWQYTNGISGLKIEATVTAKQGPKTYKFGYLMVGGARDWAVDAAGGLVSDGMSVPRAYVIGADGVRRDCTPWKLLPGPFVSFDFDDSALPPAAFPYVIDPTTTFGVTVSDDDGVVGRHGPTNPPTTNYAATIGPSGGPERSFAAPTYSIYQALMRWDTSAVPDTATINGATLSVYMSGKSDVNGLSVVVGWISPSLWPIDATDYAATPETNAHAGTPIASVTTGAQYNFVLANAAANVSKTGYTAVRTALSEGTPTGYNYLTFAFFDHATEPEPRLIIDYTDGAGKVRVTKDAPLAWSIRAAVNRSAPLTWHIRQTANRNAPLAWAIRTAVARAAPLGWRVWGNAARNAPLAWNVRKAVTKSSPLGWSVRAGVAQSAAIRWFVRQATSRSAPLSWQVRAATSRNSPLGWHVRQGAARAAGVGWHVRQAANRQAPMGWAIRQAVNRPATVTWTVESSLARVGRDAPLAWTLRGAVFRSSDLRWHTRGDVSRSASLAWHIRAPRSRSIGMGWQVRQGVSRSSPLGWITRGNASRAAPLTWHIRQTTNRNAATHWHIRQTVNNSAALGWQIRQALARNAALSWTVWGRVGQAVGLRWSFDVIVVLVVNVTVTIPGTVNRTVAIPDRVEVK